MTEHDQLLKPYVQRLQSRALVRWFRVLPLEEFLVLLGAVDTANRELVPELREGKPVSDDRFLNVDLAVASLLFDGKITLFTATEPVPVPVADAGPRAGSRHLGGDGAESASPGSAAGPGN